MLAEALSRARDRGVPTAVGRATSDDDAPALWPWSHLVAELRSANVAADLVDPTEVSPAPGESAAALAASGGATPSRERADRRRARRRSRPGLEDPHWADEETLRLFNASRGDRAGGPPAAARDEPDAMSGDTDQANLLPLSGLAVPDIARWLRADSEVDPARAAELRRYHRRERAVPARGDPAAGPRGAARTTRRRSWGAGPDPAAGQASAPVI